MKKIELTKRCPTCGGLGKVDDPLKIGPWLREEREAATISLRKMAEYLRFSPAFLSDVELGKRSMSREAQRIFLLICKERTE